MLAIASNNLANAFSFPTLFVVGVIIWLLAQFWKWQNKDK